MLELVMNSKIYKTFVIFRGVYLKLHTTSNSLVFPSSRLVEASKLFSKIGCARRGVRACAFVYEVTACDS